MTIASMMPVALNMICRSATAIGPFGSRMPSVQPTSSATPIRGGGGDEGLHVHSSGHGSAIYFLSGNA
jgi:hypothetical protein